MESMQACVQASTVKLASGQARLITNSPIDLDPRASKCPRSPAYPGLSSARSKSTEAPFTVFVHTPSCSLTLLSASLSLSVSSPSTSHAPFPLFSMSKRPPSHLVRMVAVSLDIALPVSKTGPPAPWQRVDHLGSAIIPKAVWNPQQRPEVIQAKVERKKIKRGNFVHLPNMG